MSDPVWISDAQHTINQLLDRRLEDDPDSEYLDVCGTKLTAAGVANGESARQRPGGPRGDQRRACCHAGRQLT